MFLLFFCELVIIKHLWHVSTRADGFKLTEELLQGTRPQGRSVNMCVHVEFPKVKVKEGNVGLLITIHIAMCLRMYMEGGTGETQPVRVAETILGTSRSGMQQSWCSVLHLAHSVMCTNTQTYPMLCAQAHLVQGCGHLGGFGDFPPPSPQF